LGVASPPPLVLQFGGFVGTVFVDDIVFDHASRWFQVSVPSAFADPRGMKLALLVVCIPLCHH
jgi:hypothetical protein